MPLPLPEEADVILIQSALLAALQGHWLSAAVTLMAPVPPLAWNEEVVGESVIPLTVREMSSVAVPQLGSILLVIVNLIVAVPAPVTFTVGVSVSGLRMTADAPGETVNRLHKGIPFAPVPFRLKTLAPEVT